MEMNSIVICLIITCCIVYVWDYVMFPQELANQMADIITKGKIKHVKLRKPLSCSLCCTTYITLVILLCTNWVYCPLCLVYGWSTQYILVVYNLVDKLMVGLLSLIDRAITK